MADSPINWGLQYRGGVAAPTQKQSDDGRLAVAAQPSNPGTEYELHRVIDWSIGPLLADINTARARVIYVGKHGTDTKDGTCPSKAVLTLAQAVTLVTALTPSTSSPVLIHVVDGGSYAADNVTIAEGVKLFAPNARFEGTQAVNPMFTLAGDQSIIEADSIVGDTGQDCVVTSATAGTKILKARYLNCVAASGAINDDTGTVGSKLIYNVSQTLVTSNGVGVGDVTTDGGTVHVIADEINLAGDDAIAVARAGAGVTLVRIGSVVEISGADTIGFKGVYGLLTGWVGYISVDNDIDGAGSIVISKPNNTVLT